MKKGGLSGRPLTLNDVAQRMMRNSLPAAATTTTRGTRFLFLGHVDAKRTTAILDAIQRLDGRFGLGLLHFNEAEPAGPTGVTIGNQLDGCHGTVGLKHFPNFIFRGAEREVADINRLGHEHIPKQINKKTLPCEVRVLKLNP